MKKYLILTAIAIASLTACKTGTTIGKEDLTFPFGNRLLIKLQLARPGRGWDTGALRNFLAEGTANDAAVISRITGYTSIWDLDLDSYQVHARCILLDTKTGYRSQFLQVSGVVHL